MAKVLTGLGIPCGHESIFDYAPGYTVMGRFHGRARRTLSRVSQKEGKNWVDIEQLEADSSYMAVPYLNQPWMQNVKVLHIVRHPIEVVSSFLLDLDYFKSYRTNYEKWILYQLPSIEQFDTQLERVCYYYIQWNKMIETSCKDRPYFRHRVEDPLSDEFFKFLDVKPKPTYDNNKSNSMRKNRHFGADISLTGALGDEFLDLIFRYGYVLPKFL